MLCLRRTTDEPEFSLRFGGYFSKRVLLLVASDFDIETGHTNTARNSE